MNAAACPEKSVLQSYALGTLPVDEAEWLTRHLDECSECESTIHGVEGVADTVISGLRKAETENPYADEPGCQQAVAVLKSLRPGQSERKAASSDDEDLGRIGQYQLLSKLGAGGMGTVYRARHTRLDRIVAVKLLAEERLRDEQAVARFEREMKAVGKLDHPNIVRAHDAGEADGRHYLAMEFVQGMDLSRLSKRCGPMEVADACELVRQAAVGLAHAHEHGLVHRDVKPSNLMLTLDRQVKILDLGLARLQEESDEQELTSAGQMMGTLDYMAPEQCGGAHEADARADIYALGATLYKLLCGRSPYSGSPRYDARTKKLAAILTEQPPALAERRGDLPAELVKFVEQMMSRDPAERLASSSEVARALSAWTTGHDLSALLQRRAGKAADASVGIDVSTSTAPIASAVLSDTETIRRAVPAPAGQPPRRPRRRTVIAAAAAAALVLLGIFLIIRDRDGKEKARIALQDGDSIEVVDKTAADAKPEVPKPPTNRPAQIEQRPAVTPTYWPADHLRRADIPAYELAAAGNGDPSKAPPQLVAVLGNSRLRHWSDVRDVAFSPDGKTVYSGSSDGTVKAWDTSNGRSLHTFRHEHSVWSIALSPDGKTLFTGAEGKATRCWDTATGKSLETEITDHGTPAISPDGKLLAVNNGNAVRLWDTTAFERLHTFEGHEKKVTSVAFSPNGRTLGSASHDQTIKLWDVASGKELRTLRGHGQGLDSNGWYPVNSVAFSPDGDTVASGSHDGTVRLWNVATGDEQRSLQGRNAMLCVTFSPDGKIIAGSTFKSSKSGVIFWEAATGKEVKRLTTPDPTGVYSIAFDRDGKTLVTGSADGGVRLWDVRTGKQRLRRPDHRGYAPCMAVSSDGARLATGNDDGTLKVWDVATGKEHFVANVEKGEVFSVAFSPDGKIVATGGRDSTIKFWDAETRRKLRTLKGHGNSVMSLAFAPDGKTLASGSYDKTIKLWDVMTGQELPLTKEMANLRGHTGAVTAVCFSPDGATLASGSGDHTVRLWDCVTGEQLHMLKRHNYAITSVAFSPDGKLLISSELTWGDATVRLWDVATGEQRRTLKTAKGWPIYDAKFSPDGKTIVSSNMDGTVRLWNPNPPLGESMLRETLQLGPAIIAASDNHRRSNTSMATNDRKREQFAEGAPPTACFLEQPGHARTTRACRAKFDIANLVLPRSGYTAQPRAGLWNCLAVGVCYAEA